MKIVLIGPQGSGKGAQARILASKLGIPHISTGGLFREKVIRGTEMGRAIADILERGDLVPDDIVITIANERLSRNDCVHGFIADGFPRNLRQFLEIEVVWCVDYVFELSIDTATSIRRLAERLTCRKCGNQYGTAESPKTPGKCDICGTSLIKRADDRRKDVVIKRLETYWREVLPVLEYYRSNGVLKIIDGRGKIKYISQQIFQAAGILVPNRHRKVPISVNPTKKGTT